MKKRKVVCQECQKVFLGYSASKRCKKCNQRLSRQQRYWNTPEQKSGDANHTFYAFAKDLKPDELVALVSINKKKLKYINDFREFKEIRSCIKICTDLYMQKTRDRFPEQVKGYKEMIERKEIIEQIGVMD
jgi:hypothetical protein